MPSAFEAVKTHKKLKFASVHLRQQRSYIVEKFWMPPLCPVVVPRWKFREDCWEAFGTMCHGLETWRV